VSVVFPRNPADQACGQVAQMVERSPEKAGVGGSIPSLATIVFLHLPPRLPSDSLDSVSIHCIISPKVLNRSTAFRCDSGTNCW
jgi:hypothetical protein